LNAARDWLSASVFVTVSSLLRILVYSYNTVKIIFVKTHRKTALRCGFSVYFGLMAERAYIFEIPW
jgi:hypothetical protein